MWVDGVGLYGEMKCPAAMPWKRLTLEVRRDQRRRARPGRGMIDNARSRAWGFAVGPRLDRGVRRLHSYSRGVLRTKNWMSVMLQYTAELRPRRTKSLAI